MHAFTTVLVEAPAHRVLERAEDLIDRAAARHGADYWKAGGRFDDRLAEAGISAPGGEAACIADLPRPLPDGLVGAAFVDTGGRWHWQPLVEDDPERGRRWRARLEGAVERLGDDGWIVIFDVHF